MMSDASTYRRFYSSSTIHYASPGTNRVRVSEVDVLQLRKKGTYIRFFNQELAKLRSALMQRIPVTVQPNKVFIPISYDLFTISYDLDCNGKSRMN